MCLHVLYLDLFISVNTFQINEDQIHKGEAGFDSLDAVFMKDVTTAVIMLTPARAYISLNILLLCFLNSKVSCNVSVYLLTTQARKKKRQFLEQAKRAHTQEIEEEERLESEGGTQDDVSASSSSSQQPRDLLYDSTVFAGDLFSRNPLLTGVGLAHDEQDSGSLRVSTESPEASFDVKEMNLDDEIDLYLLRRGKGRSVSINSSKKSNAKDALLGMEESPVVQAGVDKDPGAKEEGDEDKLQVEDGGGEEEEEEYTLPPCTENDDLTRMYFSEISKRNTSSWCAYMQTANSTSDLLLHVPAKEQNVILGQFAFEAGVSIVVNDDVENPSNSYVRTHERCIFTFMFVFF